MADAKKLVPFILGWEGGYVNDPDDSGGETNRGITIATWKAAGHDCSEKIPSINTTGYKGKPVTYKDVTKSLYEMTDEQWFEIFKKKYWDRWKADQIKSQSVANILVDWVWGSGKWGIIIPQRILGVTQDGIVGPKTIAALNARDPQELFMQIKNARGQYLEDIIKKTPSNEKFRKGWFNRLNALKYEE